ncbi:ERI1 exoribonuclease 3 [Physocladia obscura]|uniref:ERI1 exoribonuclease 3 n=1 Tax=Physocladia obscura TaxID=109957 RepID=A0AAD5SRJ0_9FUNG|nr:ERI1 exoribonuclease 3 [Physocladia obscura]
MSKQRYTFLAVIDFEASIRDEKGNPVLTEFPIVLLSVGAEPRIAAEFHTFVQPPRSLDWANSKGITASTFEAAPPFPLVWASVARFFVDNNATAANTLLITCGDWDLRALLPAELSRHQLSLPSEQDPLFLVWCNIKHAFFALTGKKADSMVRMLNVIGQPLVGVHHSGIDDSRNIASIAQWMLHKGHIFKPTNKGEIDDEDVEHKVLLQQQKLEARELFEANRETRLANGAISPQQLFRDTTCYSCWDIDGIPTHLVDGTPLTRSAINKKKKLWKAQEILHQKYLKWKFERVTNNK